MILVVEATPSTGASETIGTVETMHFYPFGMQMEGIGTAAPANKYLYNGKERNEDFGLTLYDYGARWYDPTLGRWGGMDPLAEKYQEWSGYNYGIDNPIVIIDSDGRSVMNVTGDYYNEKGEKIANDGKDDHKIFVIKTTKTTDELYGPKDQDEKGKTNPISAEDANITEEALKAGDFEGDHMKNVAYFCTTNQMEKMMKVVSQDDGTRGTAASNNREYGGITTDTGKVVEAPAGGVGDPSKGSYASVSLPEAGKSDFHSHPSGTKRVLGGTAMWGFQKSQAPSNQDIKTAKSRSFVFGMRDGTIYLFDKKGVKATIPMSTFK